MHLLDMGKLISISVEIPNEEIAIFTVQAGDETIDLLAKQFKPFNREVKKEWDI